MSDSFILLHTADWHLGHSLYGVSQKKEHSLFLTWMLETIKKEKADALLIAGDIFDQANPPSYARRQYFDFLLAAKKSGLKQIFILAGNHDSPSDLAAPKSLLQELEITVVNSCKENVKNLIFSLKDKKNKTRALLSLLPYPRETELRPPVPGESFSQREKSWQKALEDKYKNLLEETKKQAETHVPKAAIIGTGHLSLSSAKTAESEVKPYFADLSKEFIENYLSKFDYFALGHFHRPQTVLHKHIAYSGSPLPLSFSEEKDHKRLMKLSLNEKNKIDLESIQIPKFRNFYTLESSYEKLEESLKKVKASPYKLASFIRLKLNSSKTINSDFCYDSLKQASDEYQILKIIHIDPSQDKGEREKNIIEELSPEHVFSKICEQDGIKEDKELKALFQKVLGESLCEL